MRKEEKEPPYSRAGALTQLSLTSVPLFLAVAAAFPTRGRAAVVLGSPGLTEGGKQNCIRVISQREVR